VLAWLIEFEWLLLFGLVLGLGGLDLLRTRRSLRQARRAERDERARDGAATDD
jgi:hypothetical protein